MLITRNQDPFKFGVNYAKSAAKPAQTTASATSSDSVSLGDSRPAPLTYVPTGAGTAALAGTMVGTGAGVGLLLNALTGNAGLSVGAGLLTGFAASVFVANQMDKGAEKSYGETGQGSLWLQPAFTPEEISGFPRPALGVRGLA